MKKFLALIMVVAMVASFATVIFAEDETKSVTYTFDGNKADDGLTVNGDVKFADGKATFGAGGYITSDFDLRGATSFKITFKLTPVTDVNGNRWIFEISSEEKHPDGEEHYFGAFFGKKNTFIDGEAYGGGKRPDHTWVEVKTPDEPIEFTYAYDDATRTVTTTVNGEGGDNAARAMPDDGRFTIANIIGENPHIQFGRGNWGNGEDAPTLVIDEIKIEATYASTPAQGGDTPAPGGQGGQGGQGSGAPATGFATVAIALAAVGSGAYVVSKKRH